MNGRENILLHNSSEGSQASGTQSDISLALNNQKLYQQLFNALTDQIEAMKAVQQKAEETYIEQCRMIAVPNYISVIERGGNRA